MVIFFKKTCGVFLLFFICIKLALILDIFNVNFHTPEYLNSKFRDEHPQIEEYVKVFNKNLLRAAFENDIFDPLPFLDNSSAETLRASYFHSVKFEGIGIVDFYNFENSFSMTQLMSINYKDKTLFSKINMTFNLSNQGWVLLGSNFQNTTENPVLVNKLRLDTASRIIAFATASLVTIFTVCTAIHCFYIFSARTNLQILWLLFLLISSQFTIFRFNLATEVLSYDFGIESMWVKKSPYDPYLLYIFFPLVELLYWVCHLVAKPEEVQKLVFGKKEAPA